MPVMTATAHNAFAGSIIDPRFGAHAMNANLFDRLERSIVDRPKAAIISPAGPTISYADLIALSGRFANVLTARRA